MLTASYLINDFGTINRRFWDENPYTAYMNSIKYQERFSLTWINRNYDMD